MKKQLFLNSCNKFKILQFTDIHFVDDNETDQRTTKLMEILIHKEKPDFIIVTGDTVYGPDNLKHIEKALEPITTSGVPWSYTFGNHDTEEGVDETVLFKAIEKLPNCLAYNEDTSISGMANHYLEVKTLKGETKWVLFGIDSGKYNTLEGVGGYAYVKQDQIQWYKKVMKELEKKETRYSSLVFMHIPLPEYNKVWNLGICEGDKREEVCCSKINSGFFTAMLEAGHTKGVFVGHDHINDFMGELYGIKLGYGRATGYNTYSQKGYLRGARIIILNAENTDSFETYFHLEDGQVIR